MDYIVPREARRKSPIFWSINFMDFNSDYRTWFECKLDAQKASYKMELFKKIANDLKPLVMFRKLPYYMTSSERLI